MMYRAEITELAKRDLAQLDHQVARRIRKRIEWLAANFESISLEPLHGPLADLFKLRVGDYRVLYDIVREDQVLLIHRIRHRREVYR